MPQLMNRWNPSRKGIGPVERCSPVPPVAREFAQDIAIEIFAALMSGMYRHVTIC
ncbi:MAG: hypothetical protein JO336_18415 [Acidobacteriia bacterium]|nr:hypothetical protein [Terriglobia bacterium]